MHKAPEAAGYGTFIVHMQCSNWSRILQVGAYAIASPLSAFIAFAIFKSQSQSAIDNPINLQTLNWWTGYTLLIAVGTLIYITLMHILPEVYFDEGNNSDEQGM